MRFSQLMKPSKDLLQYYRRISGLTIREICERLGMSWKSRSSIYDWEKGKHVPTHETLTKLAKVYNCEVNDFYSIDVETIRIESLSVIMDYFRDPTARIDNRAWVAARVLVWIAKRYPEMPDKAEKTPETEPELYNLIKD